jgi:hypothetical protein
MDYLLFVGNPTSDYSQFILLLRNLGLLCNCPMRHLEGPPQCVAVENEPLLEGPLSRLGAQAGPLSLRRHYSEMQFDFLVGR